MGKIARILGVGALAVGSWTLVGCDSDSDTTSTETDVAKVAPPKGVDPQPKEVKYKSLSKGRSAPAVLPGSEPKAP